MSDHMNVLQVTRIISTGSEGLEILTGVTYLGT